MIGLDAVDETAILQDLKLGAVVTAFRSSAFGVETVQCKDFGFTVWGVGGQVEVHPLWRHFYQGQSGLIYVVNSNDRNKVADAEEELNKLGKDEMPDAVVLALANTLTPSIATRRQKLSDVVMNEDLWWGYADGASGDRAVTEGKVQARASGAGRRQQAMNPLALLPREARGPYPRGGFQRCVSVSRR